ncbi:hypothetical protein HZH68_016404 [Vespula germanica]|uniref:Uncharacterized protein n=1 Tax=Vespula germanica TaxID=30212 RepID=A0A834MR33_VESGE|nr:hypothetical protein HZH68_016404 [Vespula germanica]
MLKVFKLISILILILSIFFQLISSKPFIQSLNISKINKEPNFRHSSNDEEQMAIMFNQTLDYFIPRRRLLDNQYHQNYSKDETIRPFNVSINYNKNNLNLSVTPAWTIDLLPNITNVPVNIPVEYISSTSFVEIEYDTTHVRRKRNAAVDDNQSKTDEEHENVENPDKKRSSSSSSSDNDEDSSDQRSNLQKSENDESEDYSADLEESNDTETDDDQDKVQSKDTKMKRESSDYEYVEDQDKSSGDVRVKREETNQTNEKIKSEESNKNVEENAEKTDKSDERVNESDSKRDAAEEKNTDTVESPKLTKEDDSEYEKRVEEKIKRKIDSIKEEIKREIERKRRDREIERNNARFDELQSKDNDEQEEQEAVSANVDEKMSSKRSSDEIKPKIIRRRRRRRRRRRSNESERIRHRLEEIEGVDNLKDEDDYRAAVHESIRKRFAPDESSDQDEPKVNRISLNKAPIKKREKIRQMYVVKNDNDKRRRKKRKRRVADEGHVLVPEQAHVKIEDDLPRDLTFDPKLRRSQPLDEKVRIKRANARLVTLEYRPQNIEDEENDEGNEFGDDGFEDRTSNLKDRISNSLIEDQEDKENQHSQSDLRALASSAKDSNRRLITDYNEAFGGLQSLQDNPNGALSRFKRIKRVLKTSQVIQANTHTKTTI